MLNNYLFISCYFFWTCPHPSGFHKKIGSNVLEGRPVDKRPNDRGDNHTPSMEVRVVVKTTWKQHRRCVGAFLGQTSRIPRSHLQRTRSWGPLCWSANHPWSVTKPSMTLCRELRSSLRVCGPSAWRRQNVRDTVWGIDRFMNLLQNLDLISRERPYQGRKILGLPWNRQATQDISRRHRAKERWRPRLGNYN